MDKKALRLSPLALALAAVAAHAQQPAPAQPPGSQPGSKESITVTGYRASLESALNAKRQENSIVDVIKAEDIAKFPDTNLAESLQRVPGVALDRDAGEGRNITVRGLGPDFTRVRINGIEALATTGGTDSSGGNNRTRGFDFNVFPSELFSTLTVRKSSSADVDEGSLGATVDLATPHPFDFRDLTATVAFKERYNDLSKTTDPRVAFLASNTYFDRKVGVLLSGAYSKRRLYEEGFGSVRWDNGPSSGGWCAPVGVTPANPSNSTATTCGPSAQGVARLPGTPDAIAAYTAASDPKNFHPRLPRYGRLTHDQDRTGFAGSLQVRPGPATTVTADFLYSKLNATRHEDWLEALSFSRTAGQGGKPQTSVVSTAYGPNGALLYGTYNGVDIRAESRFDELHTTFTQPTLYVEHEFSEWLKGTARVGRAESKFRNPVQTTTTLDALNVNGYGIDFRGNDRLPSIVYPFDVTVVNPLTIIGVPQVASGTQPSTIPNTTSSEIRIRPQGSNNKIDVANAELAWEASPGRLTIRGGPDYKKYAFDTFEFRRVNQNDTIFAPTVPVSSLVTQLTGFGSELAMPGSVPRNWVIPDLNAIVQAYNIYCNCLQSGPAGGPGDFTLSSITNGNARGNNRAVTETDRGGYAQADFSYPVGEMGLRGNFGVRYVQTRQVASGFQATGGGTQVTVENTYNDFLPALNLALELNRDMVVRFAAAKVMARPQLANLTPGGSISTTGNLAISVGNPFLKPFRAKTIDTAFEWYFQKNALLSVGLFYKDIDTYIQSLVASVPYNQTGLPLSLLPSNFTGTEVFAVTTPVNTTGGNLSGYEINFQYPFTFLPWWGRNFGTLLNYTYVKSKINYLVSPTSAATIQDDLLNLSPKSWNATLYYDDGRRFSARVSAAYRQAYLQRVPGQNNNDVEGKNSTLNVDASVSYRVNKNVELTLEGVNLTNEVNDQFTSRARNSSVVYSVTGREYLAGIRVNF
ncbi:MAG TPA: TonB-dependent receptor [Usitatibacter sp.]|nr:TonB-dependent receptor [Usitatibacter sp.]